MIIEILKRPRLVFNLFQRVNSYKCVQRYCSSGGKSGSSDDGGGGGDGVKSDRKYKGVRLPDVNDRKDIWKAMTYEFYEDLGSFIPRDIDVLIIGGGIIGWSVAYFLRHNAMLQVMVVERDPSHTRCATVLGIGAVRQQFSEPENIQMSLFGAEFLRNVREHLSILDLDPPDIQFHPHGFLTLSSVMGFNELRKCFEIQKQLGAKVELLTKHEIKSIWPWMETEDIGGGIHGYENEGWFDSWQLLNALQRKASSLGVQRVVGEVIGFEFSQRKPAIDSPQGRKGAYVMRAKNALIRLISGEVQPVQFAYCVNAGGPWAGEIGRLMGMGNEEGDGGIIPLPVEPRIQHSFVVSPSKTDSSGSSPGIDCPFIVDYNGLNVRRDRLGGDFVVFVDTPPLSKHYHKPIKVDDKVAGESGLSVNFEHFETVIRPLLSKRIPSFENAKVRSGWASYLDYNYIDQNLIIGSHPVQTNFLFTNGSSGHGIEHSMAIGRAIYELVIYSEYKTINLKNFGMQRFYENMLVYEKEVF